MRARNTRDPAHGTERSVIDRRSAGAAAPPAEEAVIGELAMAVCRAAARGGRSPEAVLAAVSDAELSALYLRCAHAHRERAGRTPVA
ncbi:hypothetical protein [Streptomyces sp. HPF1205]|uniref:hypothetical protein n=1 Tax=Streptomyces sp. HPF1205 TaxID=2873262 RepID=UPI001CECBDC9|nr:hypothetical protein [Streptomyces sp. HPF1205]